MATIVEKKPVDTPQRNEKVNGTPRPNQISTMSIDLTREEDGSTTQMSHQAQEDHMHPVADLIRSRRRKRSSSDNPATPSPTKPPQKKSSRASPFSSKEPTSNRKSRNKFKMPPAFAFPELSLESTSSTSPTPQCSRKPKRQPFRFLALPPEIRNDVYTLLLCTPTPIELPRAARTAAARSAAWAEAQATRKRRASFKTMFLEILQTSRQVHAEATSILYGANVFKFRSDHKEGLKKKLPLPEKHLVLLRHVKLSVISREQEVRQDVWVAKMLEWFRAATLKTFEMTWYGWKRYRLLKDGVLCQALLALSVEELFAVKVAGEARMQRIMMEELESGVGAKKVEILRPIMVAVRNGQKVEVSDDEKQGP